MDGSIVSNFPGVSEVIKHGSEGYIMNPWFEHSQKDFRSVFEDLDTLKVCSMNIFQNHIALPMRNI